MHELILGAKCHHACADIFLRGQPFSDSAAKPRKPAMFLGHSNQIKPRKNLRETIYIQGFDGVKTFHPRRHAVAREDVRFSVRGRSWTLDEMETVYDNRWNFGEKARIIALSGELAAGDHAITFAVRMRVSYLPFVPTTKDTKQLALAA